LVEKTITHNNYGLPSGMVHVGNLSPVKTSDTFEVSNTLSLVRVMQTSDPGPKGYHALGVTRYRYKICILWLTWQPLPSRLVGDHWPQWSLDSNVLQKQGVPGIPKVI